jgi:hypothetical protein
VLHEIWELPGRVTGPNHIVRGIDGKVRLVQVSANAELGGMALFAPNGDSIATR